MWTKNCIFYFIIIPSPQKIALYFHVVARNEPMVYTKDRCKYMVFFWNIQIFYIIFLIFAVKSAFFWFKASKKQEKNKENPFLCFNALWALSIAQKRKTIKKSLYNVPVL